MTSYFITATGTDIGKTYVSANLLRHWRREQRPVAALKPVMSGFDPQAVAASDAGQLLLAMDAPMDAGGLNLISPWRFAAPLSPDMAAAREGKTIPYDKLVATCRSVAGMMPDDGRLVIEGVGGVFVPIDDTHTMFHFIAWNEDEPAGVEPEAWRKFCAAQVGIDVDRDWQRVRGPHNRYGQDRQAMKLGSFTGIDGIPNQDVAMWETMGPIADRSRERLGASDLAIVEFRKQMVEAVRAFASGGRAIGTGEDRIPPQVCAFQAILPKSDDWRAHAAQPVLVGES